MKKFFGIVLFIAIAAIAGYGIKYAVTPVNSQKIEYMTQENFINTNGFIIRDEWVETSRSAGTVYHSAKEGERVAKDSIIGELFYGDVSENSVKELAGADNKIRIARNDMSLQSVTALDETTIENSIYRRENDIINSAEDNDIQSISRYRQDINSLREGGAASQANTLAELEAQRQSILNGIGVAKEDITAQISGIFTTYTDGYEDLLKPADIESYDTSYFEQLSQSPKETKIDSKVDAGGAVCKIVNNHEWYVMMDVPSDVMKEREIGDGVKLRFNNMARQTADGGIYAISGESDGRMIVTVKCSKYLESVFSYRLADVDLIFESYTGYKIPTQAVHTDPDGKQKVIGLIGNTKYDCYIDTLFTNAESGYMIVESTDDAQNRLSRMERIMVGER